MSYIQIRCSCGCLQLTWEFPAKHFSRLRLWSSQDLPPQTHTYLDWFHAVQSHKESDPGHLSLPVTFGLVKLACRLLQWRRLWRLTWALSARCQTIFIEKSYVARTMRFAFSNSISNYATGSVRASRIWCRDSSHWTFKPCSRSKAPWRHLLSEEHQLCWLTSIFSSRGGRAVGRVP